MWGRVKTNSRDYLSRAPAPSAARIDVPAANARHWRLVVRPDILMLACAVQALFPYCLWAFNIGTAIPTRTLTYTPVAIWVAAVASFWLGGQTNAVILRPLTQLRAPIRLTVKPKAVLRFSIALLLAISVQLAFIIRLYGTIPMLSYLRQDGLYNISTATRLQAESGLGQIGLLNTTVMIGNAALVLLCVIRLRRGPKWATPLLVLMFLVLTAAGLYNGKRHCLLTMCVYIAVTLIFHTGDPLGSVRILLPFLRNRVSQGIGIGVLACGVIYAFGWASVVRNVGRQETSGVAEAIAYYEYPLLNFEEQCRVAGFGPYRFNVVFPVARLLPYKLVATADSIPAPPRIEPSAPAGMFEDIQWAWGLWGVAGFAFSVGCLSMYIYERAARHLTYLLIYGQVAVALMFGHSFNFFLILTFFAAPTLAYVVVGAFCVEGRRPSKAQVRALAQTAVCRMGARRWGADGKVPSRVCGRVGNPS